MDSIKTEVSEAINSNQVVVFSKSYCPYCDEAKNILLNKGKLADVVVRELDIESNGSKI
jgi:glutaredoxin 3